MHFRSCSVHSAHGTSVSRKEADWHARENECGESLIFLGMLIFF